jgi:hypothetical protein
LDRGDVSSIAIVPTATARSSDHPATPLKLCITALSTASDLVIAILGARAP